MPNVPVRNLGGAGIITDIHPYDLPPNVFSAGVNVRFENGTMSRGPVSRLVTDLSATNASFQPAYLFTLPSSLFGSDTLVTTGHDFSKVYTIQGNTVRDVTPSGVVVGDTGEPFNHAFLGNVAYLNRRSNVPFKMTSANSTFVPLANWDPQWRCSVLRAYKDFLVAFNVRKGPTEYPQLIKWSDITQMGNEPPSWDHTSTTNSAGENIINEMRGPILDAHVLRDTMMIYGENEVWAMNYIGGTFIFDFRKRFDGIGVLNTDCVVEVDGKHYVFDRDDIIVHDGTSKQSLAHGRVKDFIYGGLIRDYQHLAFVAHDPRLNEIWFCYPSADRLAGFAGPETGCNRAAAYNYRRDTWTFYDLPNVTGYTRAVLPTGVNYNQLGDATFRSFGGTYKDDSDFNERYLLMTSRISPSQGITASRVVGLDLISGSRLAKTLVPELLKTAFAERIGIDLDESGAALNSYKSLLRVYPQVAVGDQASKVRFQFGANDTSAVSPAWDEEQAFSPFTDHQVNIRRAGRYLAHRLTHSDNTDFSYSGFDATIVVRGRR